MITMGDFAQCPECARMGRVVWVSENGATVGIKCSASHHREGSSDAYGFQRSASKASKNSVFLVKTESL
jgi:hypothetical protein